MPRLRSISSAAPPRPHRGFSLVELTVAVSVFALAALMFVALYPTASKAAKMTGSYSQAISIVQHKVDQLRAVGYGSLNYTNLANAGLIDTSTSTMPFHFEAVDGLANELKSPVGTINVSSYAANVSQVDISLTWQDGPGSPGTRTHAVSILIAETQ